MAPGEPRASTPGDADADLPGEDLCEALFGDGDAWALACANTFSASLGGLSQATSGEASLDGRAELSLPIAAGGRVALLCETGFVSLAPGAGEPSLSRLCRRG